ncbi:MAG: shikimate dehydrogenase, partial [Bacteroidota bacterium]
TALRTLGLDYDYRAVDVEPAKLRQSVEQLVAEGCAGFNVTIPHKQSIMPMMSETTEEARAIGAVNTVVVRDGRLYGYNTDVVGVRKSLEPYRTRLEGKTAVVLGAGGAARAVLQCLAKDFKPAGVTILARTLERGKKLTELFAPSSALPLDDPSLARVLEEATLIVNVTPLGMTPEVSASPLPATTAFHRGQIVFDLIHTPLQTTLLKIASARGATTIGGLEMLLHQGAKAFELFTGSPMPMEAVREAVEKKLKIQSP